LNSKETNNVVKKQAKEMNNEHVIMNNNNSVNIVSYEGNANQNTLRISLHTCQTGNNNKKRNTNSW
jgi:hypothetical protein